MSSCSDGAGRGTSSCLVQFGKSAHFKDMQTFLYIESRTFSIDTPQPDFCPFLFSLETGHTKRMNLLHRFLQPYTTISIL